MVRYGSESPCPVHTLFSPISSAYSDDNSVWRIMSDDFGDDTTQLIARTIRQEFILARPVRKHTLTQKPERIVPVSIFEDGATQPETYTRGEKEPRRMGTMHSQPARKIRLETLDEDDKRRTRPQARRVTQPVHEPHAVEKGHCKNDGESLDSLTTKVKRDERASRRRTIWVPSDDTTIMTIHPGAHTHTLFDETLCVQHSPNPRSETVKVNLPRPARLSLSLRPKRAPLAHLSPTDSNVILSQIPGAGRGKENRPPEHESTSAKQPSPAPLLQKTQAKHIELRNVNSAVHGTRLSQSTAASQAKQVVMKRNPPHARKLSAAAAKLAPRVTPVLAQTTTVVAKPRPVRPWHESQTRRTTKSTSPLRTLMKLSVPSVSTAARHLGQYPVLPEDLSRPELYEDNWLSHQEASLTQLINILFEQEEAQGPSTLTEKSTLRSQLLAIYHRPDSVNLHKRLTASLQCGALSTPRGMDPPKSLNDMALRRRFLDLWLRSYNTRLLEAAVEVIVGRQSSTCRSYGDAESFDKSSSTKELEQFLLTFIVRHEDVVNDEALPLSPTSKWQRTILRSLMLIHLMDQAKESKCIATCLFRLDSRHRSSVSILHALSGMLMPSVGDVGRTLRYLDYKLTHVQYLLQEYKYRIESLAVDLRDGIRLTHLVELLVYPPASLATCPNNTMTLVLASGEALTSTFEAGQEQQDVLSRHLSFPCVSRAQKLYNVQIALRALSDVDGLASTVLGDVSAQNIVDGHREKTLSLLWALVSRWGLSLLVDWSELGLEINRLSHDPDSGHTIDYKRNSDLLGVIKSHQPDSEQQINLLKAWASSICSQAGIPINNLTSSFADGKAISAIVDAYAAYIPMHITTSSTRDEAFFDDKLRALGCSTAFISLFSTFTTGTLHIPDRNTTISTLAFLASRLLPLSRAHRAACTLQRAVRSFFSRRAMTRRLRLAKMAHACASVVLHKQEIAYAATILQRAWRAVLERRIGRLVDDMLTFQTVARGWAVRRAMRGTLPGLRSEGMSSGMGGW